MGVLEERLSGGVSRRANAVAALFWRGPDAPIHSLPEGAPPAGRQDNNSLDPPRKKNAAGDQGKNKGGRKKKREYVPQRRSGGYAVLLTLYRVSQIPGSKGYMFKMELQAEAQQLCDKSFSVPDLGSKYTAWSSVSTLIQKNLVMKTHNPARYSLTEEGLALGECLESLEGTKGPEGDREEARSEGNEQEEGEEGGPGIVDLTVSDDDEEEKEEERIQPTERPTSSASQPRVLVPGMFFSGKPRNVPSRKPKSWSLLPGSYEIILCVDFIETTGGSKNCKKDLVKELQRNGVTFDVRKLNVGDFLWVAREKVAPIPGQLRTPVGRELVLDYIIERKRMDDLCGSIIDGRFREQKVKKIHLRQLESSPSNY
ncbi:crossover junction endonuclease MUS81-like [Gymnodraco acuticeps]|uniref:Crossover junction endonuclease MUS81 n=1 Tax=Gymnodraco acuticeps TaxID=8218 RepID=A0A6P8VN37_GYMAC|nr:crossover junction endonuclease MUS81-like [Gymnodraco acuticeps]